MTTNSASVLSAVSSYESPTHPGVVWRSTFFHRLLQLVGVGLIYMIASGVGLALGSQDAQADVIWPANGLLLGLILLSPRRRWFDYLVCSVIANVLLHEIFNFPTSEIVIFSMANVVEILIATLLIRFRDEQQPDLSRPETLWRFLVGGVLLAPLCSGALVGLCEAFLGNGPGFFGMRDWIFGDGLGIGIMTPLVLGMRRNEIRKLLAPGRRLETIALLIAMSGASIAIFEQQTFPITFILIPLLLLVTFRLGASGGAIGIGLLAVPAAYYTVRDHGPFSLLQEGTPLIQSILLLQLYLCVSIFTVYIVGSILAERERLQEALTESHRQMEELANMDGLTQLPNRRSLELRLHEEWQRAIREHACLSALMVDVDHFKLFNDSHGHLAGDYLLREIGNVLRIVPRRVTDFACRFGGEEFLILLPQTDLHQAAEVADRLRMAVCSMKHGNEYGELRSVTVSIGVATARPQQGDASSRLLVEADHELYRAKRDGRNRVRHQHSWSRPDLDFSEAQFAMHRVPVKKNQGQPRMLNPFDTKMY
jgi:diguanylate cyclase (GGDEF)-like protein